MGKQGDIAQPQIGAQVAKQPEYIQVTLPAGVSAGQTIQVQAPDGRLNEIIIPQGFGPGSTFTVEFAEAETSPYTTATSTQSYGSAPTRTTAPPPPSQQNDHDDGFASGFNNPGFVPQA